MSNFHLKSDYQPTGDQPQAIEKLVKNIKSGLRDQVLLGVTGSGKTFTMAKVIENIGRPTLIIAHNKTLAAQLFQEFREFFPHNAVHYFVSYYDYYQPEAYLPTTDTYIQKDAKINEEIDKLRHAATQSLLTRNDVIIIASVSCIYGLGSPRDYGQVALDLKLGEEISQKEVVRALIDLQYERTRLTNERGKFKVLGDIIYVYPVSSDQSLKIEWQNNKIHSLEHIPHEFKRDQFSQYISGFKKRVKADHLKIFPAKHFVTPHEKLHLIMANIRAELEERINYFEQTGKLLEAQRIRERTNYDLEMLEVTGYCHGIENYSRHLDFRAKGTPPSTLVDYFNYAYLCESACPERSRRVYHSAPNLCQKPDHDGWLLIIDESHMTIPQVRGMFEGDQARKKILIKYGFRLPSALDNRPLNFKEFEQRINQTLYVSATPGPYELSKTTHGRYSYLSYRAKKTKGDYLEIDGIIEQLIRPTGLLDPEIEIRPTKNQIKSLVKELTKEIKNGGRVLVTTLTKRLAEDIADYLKDRSFKVCYLHSEVKTFDRTDILKSLRQGEIDIIVGINLLREGLDLPEVTLVAILDADKEGFLRNETTLIQTMGRAARHPKGRVILYADEITGSMKRAINETSRRREIQANYNKLHHITPTQIIKSIREDIIDRKKEMPINVDQDIKEKGKAFVIEALREEMKQAAKELDFEKAVRIRDKIKELKDKT